MQEVEKWWRYFYFQKMGEVSLYTMGKFNQTENVLIDAASCLSGYKGLIQITYHLDGWYQADHR